MITVSAFRYVPPFAQGLVRDLRVRWALEEVGQKYAVQLIDQNNKDSAAYRAMQPFGQVPAIEDDGFVLFESGAILLRIAEKADVLMPTDAESRSRTIAWMFAALNTVEPHIQNLTILDLSYANEEWAKARRPTLLDLVQKRLATLEGLMKDRDYLEGNRFTVADILMTTVLRFLRHCDLLAQYPALDAYRKRNEARPAFQRALDAQMANFENKTAA
jgi:glutathione S-transferase